METAARPARLAVLIVDDDAAIRESLRFLLEEEGYEVEEARDGETALTLLRADARPRVLLLDRMMPRMSGVQTLRGLSDQPEAMRRTAVLFMSARYDLPNPEDREIVAHATFATVLKPFNLDALLADIARASAYLAQ